MDVRVLVLGRLRDLAGADEMALPAPLTWQNLLVALPDALATELRSERVHIACGGTVLLDKTGLNAGCGEEVALLPPVSGG